MKILAYAFDWEERVRMRGGHGRLGHAHTTGVEGLGPSLQPLFCNKSATDVRGDTAHVRSDLTATPDPRQVLLTFGGGDGERNHVSPAVEEHFEEQWSLAN